ncbi:MAG: hypothetical protein IPP77_11860 [Bacteroidetes bacterium]|nr:hypothetical protein [Bacteroidota bacterium]
MTTAELTAFQWVKIAFVQHANAKILVLVCKTKEGAEDLYTALITHGFKIDVTKDNASNVFIFHLAFNTGERMGVPETHTTEQFPQLIWVTGGQLTHFHVGYLDDHNKTQLLPHDYIFADNLLNLN